MGVMGRLLGRFWMSCVFDFYIDFAMYHIFCYLICYNESI